MNNSELVDIQLKAFNSKDIQKFMACYHENFSAIMLETGQVLTTGKGELQQSMVQSFKAKPDAKTTVLQRLTQKDLVINQEKITNYVDGKDIKVISIYEVKDGLISRIWFSNRTVD